MNTYDWIFFDADHTLFDFDAAEHFALQSILEDRRIQYTGPHFQTYKRINKACWTAYENGELPKHRLRAIRFERFFEALGVEADPVAAGRDYLAYLAESAELLDGVSELLSGLSAHYRLALVTNGLKEVQRPRFSKSGIQQYFELIVVSDEIGVAKPEAGFFDYAFDRIGRPTPARVLIVGDNLNSDIRGGAQYGLDTCWYNPNGARNETPVRPTFEIARLEELPEILSAKTN